MWSRVISQFVAVDLIGASAAVSDIYNYCYLF